MERKARTVANSKVKQRLPSLLDLAKEASDARRTKTEPKEESTPASPVKREHVDLLSGSVARQSGKLGAGRSALSTTTRVRPKAKATVAQAACQSTVRQRPAASVAQAVCRSTVRQRPAASSNATATHSATTTCSVSKPRQPRADPGIWWSCPKCGFTIAIDPEAKTAKSSAQKLRCAKKSNHIRLKHRKSMTATTKNYFSRSSMLRAVWKGFVKKTPGGLQKADLKTNSRGRIVPKRRSAHSKKVSEASGWADTMRAWFKAVGAARKEQGITGMKLVKKTGAAQDTDFYLKILERYAVAKAASMTKSLAAAGSKHEVYVRAR